MNVFLLVLCCFYLQIHCLFEHDKAIALAQKGNLSQANTVLNKALVDDPNNGKLLYDAGVLSYKQNQFDLAYRYFSDAAKDSANPAILQEQIHFNLANTFAKQQNLQEAIEQYQKVLSLNPQNKKAKHNLEKVKEMLKQKQQQQNKEKNKQNQNNKDKNQQKNNNNDSQQEKQNKDNNKDNSKSENNQKNKSDTNGLDNKENQSQKDDQSNNSKQDESDSTSHEQEQQKDSHHNKQEREKDESRSKDKNSKDQREKRNQQQGNAQENEQKEGNDSAAGLDKDQDNRKEAEEKGGSNQAKAQENSQNKVKESSGLEKLDKQLAQLVQEQAEADAQLNKQLIKAIVDHQTRKNDDSPQW